MDDIARIFGAGLPWPATLVVVIVTVFATKVVDGWLKIRKASFDEEQYRDGKTEEGYKALITELKQRIDKLETIVAKQSDKLDAAQAAHRKCEVEQAELKGKIEVMQEKWARLEAHDKKNSEHIEQLKKAVSDSGEHKLT